MSAWYVFGALGLYPEMPGTDVLALASPLFPRATLRLPRGTLTITAPGAGQKAPFVRRLELDGRPWHKPWLRLRDLARRGELAFDLSRRPNHRWGSSPAAAPPSYGPDTRAACGR
jgi:putative alpha-1,2-mannosidase